MQAVGRVGRIRFAFVRLWGWGLTNESERTERIGTNQNESKRIHGVQNKPDAGFSGDWFHWADWFHEGPETNETSFRDLIGGRKAC
jgi:hypothetical protein